MIQKDELLAEFEAAILYSEDTKHQLSGKEQFYANDLVSQGFEVRFNGTKIFNRKSGDAPISIMRSNLN